MDNQRIFNYLTEVLFPSFCLGCKAEGSFLCGDCKSTLEISEYNYCLCGEGKATRLVATAGRSLVPGKCSRCQDKTLSGLYFALPYQEKPLTKKLIHDFKYKPYVKGLAAAMSAIIVEHLALAKNVEPEIWANSIFVPVPLEKSREKERGYNQATELIKEIQKAIPVPIVRNNLVKIRKTEPQMKLSAAQRAANLAGAFTTKKPAQFAGKKVFLVDDVYTTGATMSECAKILKQSGAKSVWGLAFAREG